MVMALTILAGLISMMFVASVASTVTELRRESEAVKLYARRHSAF
ncbi:hypothetical protein REJC140_02688 [Pseudorhizobium endolithicum]|uniref:Uncharacterized protein n=1 Tax=Pseudorhizobium endolithicum TaxID=1191678 RepID=A0ABN7JG45_9HYPH|nr:hypothetical protein [Pseudorhizobium endolithicum]CAD6415109.1 hypothetical protein REQ54_01382 [Rhizobium sp. Q54]CAD7029223.1 hypothetical protein REJC140_02688 [Pseudorhizobium endolithicum]